MDMFKKFISRKVSKIGHEALSAAKPLFLIGPPRSGTTMMTRVLNSHPRILLTNETAVFLQLAENIEKSRIGRKAGMNYGKNDGELWANILEERSRELVSDFYARIARKQGKKDLLYWGEKHPHFNRCLEFLESYFPDAVYVYAIRDPRDSICSIAEMKGAGIEAATTVWKRVSDGYERFVARAPKRRLIVPVIYETFIADYDECAEKLFSSLDLDYAPQAQKYVRNYCNVDAHSASSYVFKGAAKLKKASCSHDFASKSIGRWRHEMSEAQQAGITKLCQDFLSKYGYAGS